MKIDNSTSVQSTSILNAGPPVDVEQIGQQREAGGVEQAGAPAAIYATERTIRQGKMRKESDRGQKLFLQVQLRSEIVQ